jgi:hypothetical protein
MHRFTHVVPLIVHLVVAAAVLAQPRPAAAQVRPEAGQSIDELGVGDTSGDVVFTPVAPCRLIDTRVAGGVFTTGTVRSYDLIGPTSYASIGGNASGCAIPGDTTPVTATTTGNLVRALVLSFAAVSPTASGHVSAWPSNQAPPVASVLNFTTGVFAIANGIAVATCTEAVSMGSPCLNDLSVGVVGGPVHIVVDVLGYYTPQRYVLASNRSEFGVFGIDFPATAAGQAGISAISFHPPLAVAPTPIIIPLGGVPPVNCPGTVSDPRAAPGYLCLYETTTANIASRTVFKNVGGIVFGEADKIGAAYWVLTTGAGRAYSVGVWAVTAP